MDPQITGAVMIHQAPLIDGQLYSRVCHGDDYAGQGCNKAYGHVE